MFVTHPFWSFLTSTFTFFLQNIYKSTGHFLAQGGLACANKSKKCCLFLTAETSSSIAFCNSFLSRLLSFLRKDSSHKRKDIWQPLPKTDFTIETERGKFQWKKRSTMEKLVSDFSFSQIANGSICTMCSISLNDLSNAPPNCSPLFRCISVFFKVYLAFSSSYKREKNHPKCGKGS